MEEISEKSIKIVECITNFVSDLNENFSNKNKPISLYNRLLSRDHTLNSEQVSKHIQTFKSFFDANPDYISHKKLSDNPIIRYSDHVYINLDKIYKKTVDEDHAVIYNHLLTIYSLLYDDVSCLDLVTTDSNVSGNNSDNPMDSIKKNLPATAEGNFIKSALDLSAGISTADMEGMAANPIEAAAKIMQGEQFTKITNDLTEKINSGELTVEGLLSTAMGMLGGLGGGSGERSAATGVDLGAIMKMMGGIGAMSQTHEKTE